MNEMVLKVQFRYWVFYRINEVSYPSPCEVGPCLSGVGSFPAVNKLLQEWFVLRKPKEVRVATSKIKVFLKQIEKEHTYSDVHVLFLGPNTSTYGD